MSFGKQEGASDGAKDGVPAAIARPASPAKVVTGRAGRRLGGALNLPEDLRPEILPGGFGVSDNRENYEARLNQAVEDGKVSPAVAKRLRQGTTRAAHSLGSKR